MTKHPLLFVALLTLLSVVAALIILHFSPGEQGGQLEGVAITQVSVLEEDGGEIPLSDGLSRRLVTLLRQYDRLSYSALPSYTPQPGDLLLTGPNHGTCFYLTADAPRPWCGSTTTATPPLPSGLPTAHPWARTRPTPSGGRTWPPI